MAKNVADGTSEKSSDLSEELLVVDPDNTEFEGEEEIAPPGTNHKDPSVRRKIEDLLERKRLREELGIYDDNGWDGF